MPKTTLTENILAVENLSVTLDGRRVLERLDFTVAEGEILAVIGPNGSGKTVLLQTLIGALPFVGDVAWRGGARIGYVPQKLDIARDLPLTARDFLNAKARVQGLKRSAIQDALRLSRLDAALLSRPIGVLSGGQFQRVLVALALIGEPNVLLFDEPTAGIDEQSEEQIYETLYRLKDEKKLTIILVSHDLSVVYRYASQVLCLNRKEVCFGVPRDVLTPEMLHELYGGPHKYHTHDHHEHAS